MADLKKQFSLYFKKDLTNVLEFANMQTEFSDVMTYLIEKEIYENGLRDLSEIIPRKRSNAYFERMLGNSNRVAVQSVMSPQQTSTNSAERTEEQRTNAEEEIAITTVIKEDVVTPTPINEENATTSDDTNVLDNQVEMQEYLDKVGGSTKGNEKEQENTIEKQCETPSSEETLKIEGGNNTEEEDLIPEEYL